MDELTTCAACGRNPVVGETVSVHERDGAETAVCGLCVAKPRVFALGPALRRERIRSIAGAATVRLLAPAKAPAVGAPRAASRAA